MTAPVLESKLKLPPARFRPWWPYLQLTRPANLVTAMADILAGFAAAGLTAGRAPVDALPWLLLSTIGLYGGGVVLNDVFDARLDAQERPERPIPSGRAEVRRAALLGGLLLASGAAAALVVSLTSGALALLIATFAVLYDAWSKHRPLLGPLNMGLCRALNLLLGVSAVPAMLVERWYLALIPLAYIAAITAVSAGEVHGGTRRTGLLALGLLAAIALGLLALTLTPPVRLLPLLPLFAIWSWRVFPPFWRAFRDPSAVPIRGAVRAGVLSLIALDAAVAAGYAGLLYGAAVLSLLFLSRSLARTFAVT